MKDIESKVIELVGEYFKQDKVPCDTPFDERHLKKIYAMNFDNLPEVTFKIDRHPHLYGAPTSGLASNAFIPQTYEFTINIKTKAFSLKNFETHPIYIDIDALAYEEFNDEHDLLPDDKEVLKKWGEKEIETYALEQWEGIAYAIEDQYESELLTEDQSNQLMKAMKEACVDRVKEQIEIFLDSEDDDDLD